MGDFFDCLDIQFVACSKNVFKVGTAAAATDLAFAHNRYFVPKLVGFVHLVGSQDDSAVLLE